MVNCIYAAMGLLVVGVVILEVLLGLLINTYVHFEVPHLVIYFLLIETKALDIYRVLLLRAVFLVIKLFFSITRELLNSFLYLDVVDHLKVNNQLDDWHIRSLNELDFVYLPFIFQEFEIIKQSLHHLQ
jgi:hypothetical protein